MLCRGLCTRWFKFSNAPRRRQPTQERAAGDVETKFRRRGKAPTAWRCRLEIATLTPRQCRAGSSESSRWLPGVTTRVHRHRCTGVSASTTLTRWRIGVVALVHDGVVTLRLGIAMMARRERARDGAHRPCVFINGRVS
jgi:hypothetical protein